MTERHILDIVHDQNPVTLAAKKSVTEACTLMRHRRVRFDKNLLFTSGV